MSLQLPQGCIFGVIFPFRIQTGFRGCDLRLSLIFGMLPWRAVPLGFPYQQVAMATWLCKEKREQLNPCLLRTPLQRGFSPLLTCSRVIGGVDS